MIAERPSQGQATRPRLVPQPDGYADYVDPPQHQVRARDRPGASLMHRPGRASYAGRHHLGRGDRAPRQRSIRSTITLLLIAPLACLAAFYGYTASGTVGQAVAYQDSDALNTQFGVPLAELFPDLEAERLDTFVWQSAHGKVPRTGLDAQRALTDKAITVFRVGAAKVTGRELPTYQAAVAAMETRLTQLRAVRAEVDAGTIAPLSAFQDYNATVALGFTFGIIQANPDELLSAYQLSRSQGDMGEVNEAINQESTLVVGVMASDDTMSAAVHQQFVSTVYSGRYLQQLNSSPLAWPPNLRQYLSLYTSPALAHFKALEDKIIATPAGSRLPVTSKQWQAGLGPVIQELIVAQTAISAAATQGDTQTGDDIILRLALVGGAGLLAVILSSVLLLAFGNRISRELTTLRTAARTLAGERLPSVVSRLRAGENVDVAAEAPALDLGTRTREVTDTADAFSAAQRTAVEAAVDQARLRRGVNLVFRSLARRNQSLVQRQLRLLDEMERNTADPDALDRLFQLDHLTTRMRRQAEGLIVLSGASPGRVWREPVPVMEVLRGAIGEIEDYARVDLLTDLPDFVYGAAVADITHMLAELAENAVLYSPPSSRVRVRGGRTAMGYRIEVEDQGLGIPPDTMAVLNERLAQPPEFDLADNDRLGLFVVSRLAARHDVKVSLYEAAYCGTKAVVVLPPSLVVAEEAVPLLVAQAESHNERQQAAAAALGGLPRRQVGASAALSPWEFPRRTSLGGRSPEQARKLMSAIQQGLRSSRERPSADGGTGPGAVVAEPNNE